MDIGLCLLQNFCLDISRLTFLSRPDTFENYRFCRSCLAPASRIQNQYSSRKKFFHEFVSTESIELCSSSIGDALDLIFMQTGRRFRKFTLIYRI